MSEIVYKGFRQRRTGVSIQSARVGCRNIRRLSKRKAEQARKVRETAKSWLNVSYGSSARETLDIYRGRQARRSRARLHSRRLLAHRH